MSITSSSKVFRYSSRFAFVPKDNNVLCISVNCLWKFCFSSIFLFLSATLFAISSAFFFSSSCFSRSSSSFLACSSWAAATPSMFSLSLRTILGRAEFAGRPSPSTFDAGSSFCSDSPPSPFKVPFCSATSSPASALGSSGFAGLSFDASSFCGAFCGSFLAPFMSSVEPFSFDSTSASVVSFLASGTPLDFSVESASGFSIPFSTGGSKEVFSSSFS
mmetsp:Transcript_19072/g.26658  ORF Transcript_19072/g.26658 Transcript_19072/m.26658 type:complete len:218 (-) Transcript_19072:75-728(-)